MSMCIKCTCEFNLCRQSPAFCYIPYLFQIEKRMKEIQSWLGMDEESTNTWKVGYRQLSSVTIKRTPKKCYIGLRNTLLGVAENPP